MEARVNRTGGVDVPRIRGQIPRQLPIKLSSKLVRGPLRLPTPWAPLGSVPRTRCMTGFSRTLLDQLFSSRRAQRRIPSLGIRNLSGSEWGLLRLI